MRPCRGRLPAYFRMGTIDVSEGRFFTEEENSTRADVCVIGRDVANTLFPNINALESRSRSMGALTGSSASRGTRDFLTPAEDPSNENKAVYLPYETIERSIRTSKRTSLWRRPPGKLDEAVERFAGVAQTAPRALRQAGQLRHLDLERHHRAVRRDHRRSLSADGRDFQRSDY